MKRRLILCALLVFAVAATTAGAATPTRHLVRGEAQLRVLQSDQSAILWSGTIQDRTLGRGAVVLRAVRTDRDDTFRVSLTVFTKKGTLDAAGSYTWSIQEDGRFTYAGSIRSTHGSGAFSRARGKLRLVGMTPPDEPTFVVDDLRGWLTY